MPGESETMPLPEGLPIGLVSGYRYSQSLYAAARLGVFDVIREGSMNAADIAAQIGADADALCRLLRALTTIDLLVEDEQGRFSATAMGDLLRSDHPHSERDIVLMLCRPAEWRAWGDLYETVRTGERAFDRVNGEPFFDYLESRPEESELFNAAMSRSSAYVLPAILQAYDFSAFSRVTDVGGGKGTLLRGILERYPHLNGVLCDLPSVIAEADDLRDSPVAARCEFVGVNMFESVPPGSDAYILKHILHDWSDDECVRILRNCRRAINDSGKLLVIERVVKPPNQSDPTKWLDLQMLVMLSGRERTEAEFADLFAQSGFRLTDVIPAGLFSVIEGVPV